ncbi:DUF2201 family putative metallopeptidase [Rhodococcus koreensis]|uniref:DUF2201 family putative metallopeptidase n=1 Tax=Rhodococcus koreensis TaxID=99653 RepID=UPI0036D8EE8D
MGSDREQDLHASRRDREPVQLLAWNYAADAEINDDLLAAGVGLPEGVITPETIGCASSGIAEDHYTNPVDPAGRQLRTHSPTATANRGAGPVRGAVPDPSRWVRRGAGSQRVPTARRPIWCGGMSRRAVRGSSGRAGSAPAGLVRWAGEVLAPPTVVWDRLLRAVIRRVVADQAGRTNYSYSWPSRRGIPGHRRPGDARPVDHGLDCGRHVGIDVGGRSGCGDE